MKISRRAILATSLCVGAIGQRNADAQKPVDGWVYPIRWADGMPANKFLIRHGFTTENSWYLPGYWHTGEDWYALDDAETAGAEVIAIGPGTVVFVGSDYPGRVVIVKHEELLFSMYGHLDYAVTVGEGDVVGTGQLLGTVLQRTDGGAPSHLHFETRTFVYATEVNGDAPRYGFGCGYQCAPGPGYWPIDAPELPVDMGWLNPVHVIAEHGTATPFESTVTEGTPETLAVWSLPADRTNAEQTDEIAVTAGDLFTVRQVANGNPAVNGTSSDAYRLWYRIETASVAGWVQAVAPDKGDTGTDGRPSSIRMHLVPTN